MEAVCFPCLGNVLSLSVVLPMWEGKGRDSFSPQLERRGSYLRFCLYSQPNPSSLQQSCAEPSKELGCIQTFSSSLGSLLCELHLQFLAVKGLKSWLLSLLAWFVMGRQWFALDLLQNFLLNNHNWRSLLCANLTFFPSSPTLNNRSERFIKQISKNPCTVNSISHQVFVQPIPCQSEQVRYCRAEKNKAWFCLQAFTSGCGQGELWFSLWGENELYFCPARKELDVVLLRCFPQVLQWQGGRNANVFHAEGLCLCLEALLDGVSHLY